MRETVLNALEWLCWVIWWALVVFALFVLGYTLYILAGVLRSRAGYWW